MTSLCLFWFCSHSSIHLAYLSPNSSCQILSFRPQLKPASAIEGVPSNPQFRWCFPLWFSTSHLFGLRTCFLGCSYGSQQPLNWFPFLLYPAAGELNHLKCKSDDVTLGLKIWHWLPTHSEPGQTLARPPSPMHPPPRMLFPHPILQDGLWPCPLTQGVSATRTSLFFPGSSQTHSYLRTFTFPFHGVFLLQLSSCLTLTSDLYQVSLRTSLQSLPCSYICVCWLNKITRLSNRKLQPPSSESRKPGFFHCRSCCSWPECTMNSWLESFLWGTVKIFRYLQMTKMFSTNGWE